MKNPTKKQGKATIFYHDIGDYLTREQKLKMVKNFHSFKNTNWETIQPNEKNDWINLRDGYFDALLSLSPDKKYDTKSKSFFLTYSLGIATGKDAFLYNPSSALLERNVKMMIDFYNENLEKFISQNEISEPKDFVNYDSTRISWEHNFLVSLSSNT